MSQQNKKTHKVLIVDDDKEMVNALTRLLTLTERFNIRTASDGFMAMMRAKEWNPEVIILDIRMPGLSGYELCERIRSEAGIKSVKIFAISGMISSFEADSLPSKGIDAYMAKPFDNQELLHKLYALLSVREEDTHGDSIES